MILGPALVFTGIWLMGPPGLAAFITGAMVILAAASVIAGFRRRRLPERRMNGVAAHPERTNEVFNEANQELVAYGHKVCGHPAMLDAPGLDAPGVAP